MHTTNQMKMVFPGISVNERTARSLVAAFLVQLDPTVEELADIRTAVSEAVTNSIVHGYRSQKGDVELHIKILFVSKTVAAAFQTSNKPCSPSIPLQRRKNVPGWDLL